MTSPCTALVLSGAVAKGAFEAGVLQVLTRQRLPIVSIVGASAGALNGALLAAGIRAGRAVEAADLLARLWDDRGTWANAVDLSARDILGGRGVSTSDKLGQLLRTSIEPFVGGAHPIDLRIVLTAAGGDPTIRQTLRRTSFESVASFTGADFEDPAARERLYTAVTASAAFPGLYAPVRLPELGDCLDGGAVNNTPIGRALAGHPEIRRVVVVTHIPALVEPPRLRGLDLVGHIGEILVTERLYRDLRAARRVNRQLLNLEQLCADGTLPRATVGALRRALGLGGKRPIEIVEIRPRVELRGGAFSGLSSRALRREYIDAGRHAAEEALARPAPTAAKAS